MGRFAYATPLQARTHMSNVSNVARAIRPNLPISDPESLRLENLFGVAGKVALITGGSSGVGRMIAAAFVANGVRTYIVSRKQDRLASVVEELSKFGNCRSIRGDLSTIEGVEACVRAYGDRESTLNILVNNTGAVGSGALASFTPEGWDRVFDLNVKNLFFLTQKFLPQLRAAASAEDWARVINISSIGARTTSANGPIAYATSKAAVEHLTRLLARQLADCRITCNGIAPGWFPAARNAPLGEAAAEEWLRQTPVGRLGTTEDMGGLALFLSSRAGAYVDGQIITTDGGKSL